MGGTLSTPQVGMRPLVLKRPIAFVSFRDAGFAREPGIYEHGPGELSMSRVPDPALTGHPGMTFLQLKRLGFSSQFSWKGKSTPLDAPQSASAGTAAYPRVPLPARNDRSLSARR